MEHQNKHIFEQKVYYSDTDAYGVVWHGSYVRWLEMGRIDMLEDMGYTLPDLIKENIVLPVINLNIKYKMSAKLNDLMIIETSIQKFNQLSVTFEQKIIDKISGKTFIEALVDVVAIDSNGKLYRKMPQILLNAFSNVMEKNEKSEKYAIK